MNTDTTNIETIETGETGETNVKRYILNLGNPRISKCQLELGAVQVSPHFLEELDTLTHPHRYFNMKYLVPEEENASLLLMVQADCFIKGWDWTKVKVELIMPSVKFHSSGKMFDRVQFLKEAGFHPIPEQW